jgi:hypothetical protein
MEKMTSSPGQKLIERAAEESEYGKSEFSLIISLSWVFWEYHLERR